MKSSSIRMAIGLALILTVLTLLVPTRVDDALGLQSVSFGHPFSYVIQDRSAIDPPAFPQSLFIVSPWENPTDIQWIAFIGNLFAIGVVVFVATSFMQKKSS